MEGAVEFVSLNDHIVGVRKDVVGTIILRNTTKESIAVQMTLMHDMGTHRRRRRLTVRTCHTESLMLTCQRSQHLGAFLDVKATVAEEL